MRVNHVKESGAVRGARRIAKLELDCLSVSVPMASEQEGRDTSSLMTRNILYGGQLVGGVECQKSEREGEQQLEDVPL